MPAAWRSCRIPAEQLAVPSANGSVQPLRVGRVPVERYGNRSGASGNVGYVIAQDSITVRFEDGTYLYTYVSTGRRRVEKMKLLARKGQGLERFIEKYADKNPARKLA